MITLTIRSTHYYLIQAAQGYLMVDTGWAGGLPELRSQLKRWRVALNDLRYLMITHHHPDHAGLTQEIKQACGARLILHERQIPFLENLKSFYASKGGYVPIQVEPNDLVVGPAHRQDSRAALAKIGLRGEIVETPGHSDDSVSLVLDSGEAFVGDLHPPDFVPDEVRALTLLSWQKLAALKVKQVYPAHGDPFDIQRVV